MEKYKENNESNKIKEPISKIIYNNEESIPYENKGGHIGEDFLGFNQKHTKLYKNIITSYEQPNNDAVISLFESKYASFLEGSINNKAESTIFSWASQTNTAEAYQQSVLLESLEDPTITDYSAAYKRLIKERNKPWKINPSDIADFYLLERYVAQHEGGIEYNEDPTYLAVAKAKDQISDIGRRLLVSLAHEQLDEYDRFASVKPYSVPEDLRDTVRSHYAERIGQIDGEVGASSRFEREINAYLADFNAMLEDHADRGKVLDIFQDAQTSEMFGNAVRILESQQTGRWKVMATAMRTLMDPSIPMGEFVGKITATDSSSEITPEMEETLERHREPFLIDRLLNYVHNTGTMSARVTNYFPRAASLLLAHGIPGHEDYLLYHSSLLYGNDTLARQVRKGIPQGQESTIVKDLTAAVEAPDMPREYKYAMLLEFGDERLHEAVQKSTKDSVTPSRAYKLLQRVSHHDGHSKGRLKQVA